MTGIREKAAREAGCTYLDTSVRANNPIALVTKFHEGIPSEGSFYDENDETRAGLIYQSRPMAKTKYDAKAGTLGELRSQIIGFAEH